VFTNVPSLLNGRTPFAQWGLYHNDELLLVEFRRFRDASPAIAAAFAAANITSAPNLNLNKSPPPAIAPRVKLRIAVLPDAAPAANSPGGAAAAAQPPVKSSRPTGIPPPKFAPPSRMLAGGRAAVPAPSSATSAAAVSRAFSPPPVRPQRIMSPEPTISRPVENDLHREASTKLAPLLADIAVDSNTFNEEQLAALRGIGFGVPDVPEPPSMADLVDEKPRDAPLPSAPDLMSSSRILDDLPPLPAEPAPAPSAPAMTVTSDAMARWEAHVSRKEDAFSKQLGDTRAELDAERASNAQLRAQLARAQKAVVDQDTRVTSLTADLETERARVRTLISYLEKAKEKIESQSTNNQQLERRIRALETALDRRDSVSFVNTPASARNSVIVAPTPTSVTTAASIAARANNANAQVTDAVASLVSPEPPAATAAAPEPLSRSDTKLAFSARPQRPGPRSQHVAISDGRATLEVSQLIDLRLVALTGQPLDWRATRPDEVRHFRAQMAAARTAATSLPAFRAERSVGLEIVAAEQTVLPALTTLPAAVQVRFFVTDGNDATQFSKVLMVPLESTTLEAVRSVLTQSKRTTMLTEPSANEFVMHFTGLTEFVPIDERCRLVDLQRVRQCCETGALPLQFTLCAAATFGDRFAAVRDYVNAGAHYVGVPPLTLAGAVATDSMSEAEFDSALQAARATSSDASPHTEVTLGYRLRIGQVDRVPRGTDWVSVRVTLYHCGRALAAPMSTATLQCRSERVVTFDEWLYSNVPVASIPRETRVVVAVLGSKKRGGKEATVIGSVAMLAVDYRGRFQSGGHVLRLWHGAHNTVTGAFSENLTSRDAIRCALNIDLSAGGSTTPVVPAHGAAAASTAAAAAVPAERAARIVIFRPVSPAARRDTKAEWLAEAKPELSHNESLQLTHTLETASPASLNDAQRTLLWRARHQLSERPSALPLVLASVDWGSRRAVIEAQRCLAHWASGTPREALLLLGPTFQDAHVRAYAVAQLNSLSDRDLCDFYLPQLLQSVMQDAVHLSTLARFLIHRALQSRALVGHAFYWILRAELCEVNSSGGAVSADADDDGEALGVAAAAVAAAAAARDAATDSVANRSASRERALLLLEAFLKGCGIDQIEALSSETEFTQQLGRIAALVQEAPGNERDSTLVDELTRAPLEQAVTLPTNVCARVDAYTVQRCRVMDSFTHPLFVSLRNADRLGAPVDLIFKAGDDLRQDALAIQVFRLMERIWHEAGLGLHLTPYTVVPTQGFGGFIEVVQNAETVADVQKTYGGGASAAFSKTPLAKYLRDHNSEEKHKAAVDRFLRTTAASCVATYVLGVGDRHNDNIMVTHDGRLFHIDFSKVVGQIQRWNGIKRERAPFVLTPEFVYVFCEGDKDSPNFYHFVDLCCDAYNALRAHWRLFIVMFELMLSSGITNLQREGLAYLHKSLAIGSSNAEAKASFESLIYASLDSIATRLNFGIHILAHRKRRDITAKKP
jgi:hypothetical protein